MWNTLDLATQQLIKEIDTNMKNILNSQEDMNNHYMKNFFREAQMMSQAVKGFHSAMRSYGMGVRENGMEKVTLHDFLRTDSQYVEIIELSDNEEEYSENEHCLPILDSNGDYNQYDDNAMASLLSPSSVADQSHWPESPSCPLTGLRLQRKRSPPDQPVRLVIDTTSFSKSDASHIQSPDLTNKAREAASEPVAASRQVMDRRAPACLDPSVYDLGKGPLP